MQKAFTLVRPECLATSVVFSSPHSGRSYSTAFLRQTVLDEHTVRSSEDAFIDMLLARVPLLGAPLLAASMPRAYLDLNRAPTDLDPAVISGVRMQGYNPRVSSGLGVIPRVVANGRVIYRGKLSHSEAGTRLKTYWYPYHAQLSALLDEAHARFGRAILIDVHSMPSEAVQGCSHASSRRPEVVLGDRFGTSANPEIVDRIAGVFSRAGLQVARNTPFAGAYIVERYGHPARNRHAVQVEIDRALYMNESRIRPNGNFPAFRRLMTAALAEIVEIGRGDMPLAAE
ncbi:N-formylglutamate amidohydrolase [Rhodovulum imhoffii]|uniref:N-formylglutamate amidohydrolase n=1 Tax=Rhodovulum imhoffii TaxID=365340 RepID=A0A2T5BV41_9RHOB|nr:N-formylglutamate amidohydrolase [Rhodovulum imhoffii]MBK5934646.1 N-formylglutamate amidohydrolase [Rhodovulum imhoffii]PTN03380.1 N-formylglutamate amidohydrolase [Rhodovulum imhoffii]